MSKTLIVGLGMLILAMLAFLYTDLSKLRREIGGAPPLKITIRGAGSAAAPGVLISGGDAEPQAVLFRPGVYTICRGSVVDFTPAEEPAAAPAKPAEEPAAAPAKPAEEPAAAPAEQVEAPAADTAE
ncbi:MAG: hypothetical protein J1E42_04920 [Akkermansiaceae bacterium]|nr:hypothetical protein [Akkermansiaceae bacterium]